MHDTPESSIHDTYKFHDLIRNKTYNDCRSAISPKRTYLPHYPGQASLVTINFKGAPTRLRSPRNTCELISRYDRDSGLAGSLPLGGRNGGLQFSAARDRRAHSGSSSRVAYSPNSGCRRRSPRPLEFCADLLRIPSILNNCI